MSPVSQPRARFSQKSQNFFQKDQLSDTETTAVIRVLQSEGHITVQHGKIDY